MTAQCKHERACPNDRFERCLRYDGHDGMCRFISDPWPSLPCDDCADLREESTRLSTLLAERDAEIAALKEERDFAVTAYEGRILDENHNRQAFSNVCDQRDETRKQLAERDAEVGMLKEAAARERHHPMAPERCPVCEWTNINLMNYGTSGESKWMCHGCAASALAERERMRAVLQDFIDGIRHADEQRVARVSGGMGANLPGDALSYIQPSALSELRKYARRMSAAIDAATKAGAHE